MRKLISFLVVLTLTLAGCGGGGGDSGVRPSSEPEYPVLAAVARQLGGLSAPTFTAAQLRAQDTAILARADTLVLSDDLYLDGNAETASDLLHRRTVECIGGTCYFAATADTGIQAFTIQSLAAEPQSPNERVMPVGQRHGVGLAQAIDHGELASSEHYSASAYGGWLEHSVFGWVGAEYIGGELDGWANLYSISYGQASGSDPVAGGATWTGIATGVDIDPGENFGNVIQGQARVEILSLFRNPVLDVSLTNMYDLDAGTPRPSETWLNVRLDGSGTFRSGDSLEGRFYGPNHEEVGGVFEYHETLGLGGHIVGAFGATQD